MADHRKSVASSSAAASSASVSIPRTAVGNNRPTAMALTEADLAIIRKEIENYENVYHMFMGVPRILINSMCAAYLAVQVTPAPMASASAPAATSSPAQATHVLVLSSRAIVASPAASSTAVSPAPAAAVAESTAVPAASLAAVVASTPAQAAMPLIAHYSHEKNFTSC